MRFVALFIFSLPLLFTASTSAFAMGVEVFVGGSDGDGTGSGSGNGKSAPTIRTYRQNGLRVPAGSQCETLLIATERRMKRELTHEEIRDLLPKILLITGERLEAEPTPTRNWDRSCFTAEMKVLTPTGEVQISTLKAGDAVISIDLQTGTPVTNYVHKNIITPDQVFVTLIDQIRPLEVTESEHFYTGNGTFTPLSKIPENGSLFQVSTSKPNGLLLPVPRGALLSSPKRGTVYNLELVNEPRNFFIEGILVHNIREKM